MTRTNFKKVIKLTSFWKIDRRRGDYELPNGKHLSNYLNDLIFAIFDNNNLAIAKNGNIYEVIDNKIFIPFRENEDYIIYDQYTRVRALVDEIIEGGVKI